MADTQGLAERKIKEAEILSISSAQTEAPLPDCCEINRLLLSKPLSAMSAIVFSPRYCETQENMHKTQSLPQRAPRDLPSSSHPEALLWVISPAHRLLQHADS